MNTRVFTYIATTLYLSFNVVLGLNAQDSVVDTLSLFNSEKPLEITLTYDIKELRKNKYKEDYQPAIISYANQLGHTIDKEIKVRARGNVRKRHCFAPPIKLNFKDTYFETKPMNPFKTLKVVTHCNQSQIYQQYIVKEYLAYKIWGLLTGYSYKARLAEITYIDAMEKVNPMTRYGIILEHTEHMAERNDCIEIEPKGVHPEQTDRELMTKLCMFQYLIGNTDWATGNLHNVKILKPKDVLNNTLYVVPYDFDYAGFVNTDYAIPDPTLGIKSVRDRFYKGYARTPEEVENVLELFREKRHDIYELVESCAYLSEVTKKETLRYLDSFYDTIQNPYQRQSVFVDNPIK